MKIHRIILLAALTVLLPALTVGAATYTWTGAGFNGDQDFLWGNGFNWVGGAGPSAGEANVTLIFPNTGAPRKTTNDIVGLTVATIQFQGAGYEIHGKLNGGALTLDAASGAFVILAIENCQFAATCPLVLGDTNGVFLLADGVTATLKSRLSGPGGFVKRGAGTLRLAPTVDNAFAGTVSVEHGLLKLDGSTFGPGGLTPVVTVPSALVVGGAGINLTPKCLVYSPQQIGDASAVTVNGNGILELAGVNEIIGSLTMAGGVVDSGSALLTLTSHATNHVAFGASAILGRLSLSSGTHIVQIDGGSTLDVLGLVQGSGALTKSGAGTLILHNTNTYAGQTIVNEGTLSLKGKGRPGSTGAGTVVAAGATLSLDGVDIGLESLTLLDGVTVWFESMNGWDGPVMFAGDVFFDNPEGQDAVDNQLLLDGAVSGPGAMRKVGNGWLRLRGFANNTFTGGLYAENGSVLMEKSASARAVDGPIFIGRKVDDGTVGTVSISTKNQIPDHLPITIALTGGLYSNSSGVDGLGDIVLEGGFIYSEAGTLTLLGNITNRLAAKPGAIRGRMNLGSGQHIFYCEELSRLNVTGVLQGDGGIDKRGEISTLMFSNTNTYAGVTRVQEGDLRLEGNGRPGSTAAGTIVDGLASLQLWDVAITNETLTLDPVSVYSPILFTFGTNYWKGPVLLNADADIRAVNSSSMTLDGSISGDGGLRFIRDYNYPGDASLVLQGSQDNTYAGPTHLQAGRLMLNKHNATAIPGDLIVGFPTNGAAAASVLCQRSSQFAPVTLATLPLRRVTIHPSGALHCGGYQQFIANIQMVGGSIFTENGVINLHRDWTVSPNPGGSGSSFFGQLRLTSPINNYTHLFNIESDASLLFLGDISQGVVPAQLKKLGGGELGMIASNSFDGNFTISGGRVLALGASPFGTTAGGTIVQAGASLVVFGDEFDEAFTLAGNGYTNQGALIAQATNTFNGPMNFSSDAKIVTPTNTSLAIVTGAISGPGGVTKTGLGTLRFGGSDDNTFTGATSVREGALELTKTNANAIRGALDIAVGSGEALVRYLRPDQLSDLTPVNIGADGQLRILGHSDTIGSLAGLGIVELLGGSLITGNNNIASTYAGVISGIGGTLTKAGTNTFTLAGNNAYTGTTFVKGGTLLVRGQQPQSDVTIQTGGILGGTGTVGAISDLSGHVKPGLNTYGTLSCGGFLTHNPGNLLQVEINGVVPGVNCDQLAVNGPVTLMGGKLQVAMNFPGAVSNQYVLVKNDGIDNVTGSFIGLAEGAMLTNNGVVFQITYQGGDGNDIVLIQTSGAPGPQIGGITKLSDGTVQLTVQGQPNAEYGVEAAESLAPPILWTPIGTATASATGQFSFTDPDAPQHPVRFYRFLQQ